MTITPAEIASLPTAPTVSSALEDAVGYADAGLIPALCKGVYGSVDPSDYAAFVSPEHTLAWGIALIAAARIIDPAVSSEWPDGSWCADRFAETVGEAHRVVSDWAEGRSLFDVVDLFRAAAREVREAE